jgi:AmmeMemoRadiSam system protein B
VTASATTTVSRIRPAAVAGWFYPDTGAELAESVDALLANVPAYRRAPPKALVVPHAGFVFSGPVAANAYATWRGLQGCIAMFGPAHHAGIRGLALPDATELETPLGRVRVDADAVKSLAPLTQVHTSAPAHRKEHSLEVQLPFLQRLLKSFTVVPLAVGEAERDEVAEVIDALWDRAHILISTDLSHYLRWEDARRLDAQTADAIVRMDADALSDDQACGNVPLRGFLDVARRRGMRAHVLDLRTSGDTAGGKDKVVGYGSFSFEEAE